MADPGDDAGRVRRVLPLAALAAAALLALVGALAIGGGATGARLQDPGAVVRWGLPLAKLVVNVAAAGALGSLVLALFALAPAMPARARALDLAAGSSALLTVASGVVGVLTFLDVSDSPFALDDAFGAQLGSFLTTVALGQAWLATTLIAAVLTVLCFAVRQQTALALVAIVAVIVLLPMATQGHAAGATGHDLAISALGLHLVFAAVWLGGLVTLAVVRPLLGSAELAVVVRRYSSLALVSFAAVAFSGYVSAALRVGSLDGLLSAYGVLVLIKVAALTVLGLAGAAQRTAVIGRIERGRPAFWMLVTAELAFMGIASGVAAALARTATPVPQTLEAAATPAQILTGEPLPAALTPARLLVGTDIDPIWLLVVAFGIAFYVAGVLRLRRDGGSWPIVRTVSWTAGMLVLLWATNGGVAAYASTLVSSHLVAVLVVALVVPLLLVPAAPVALALRAIRSRSDGSRGMREWILVVARSPVAVALSHPVIAAALLAGSLWLVTLTPVFRWTVSDQLGHETTTSVLLVAGCLAVRSSVGAGRLSVRMRIGAVVALAVVLAAIGAVVTWSSGLILADWFGAMGRTWGGTPLADQRSAGILIWVVGGAAIVALALLAAFRRRVR